MRVADRLGNPVAVAQVQEDQAAVIAPALHPARQCYLLSNILYSKFATCMCAIMHLKNHDFTTAFQNVFTKWGQDAPVLQPGEEWLLLVWWIGRWGSSLLFQIGTHSHLFDEARDRNEQQSQ